MYDYFDGIILDRRWLHWEVRDIFMLHAVAHVDFAPLSLPEVGHGAGPDHGFNGDAHVLLRAVEWIAHCVSHLVSIAPQDPGGVVALAGLVTGDGFETRFVGVRLKQAIDFLFAIFDLFSDSVCCLIRVQDGFRVVHPVRLVLHVLRRWHRNGLLGVLGLVRLDLERLLALLLTLCDAIAPCRYKFGGVVDSRDLGAEIVLLLAEIEGVRDDLALKVPSEANLDLASCFQVLRL